MKHVILTIVKAQRVPCRMLMTISRIEELVRITGKVAKTLHLVLYSMRVYNIHNHSYTMLVSRVNQFLQFLWRTETRARSKEARHVIAERTVVRMLLDSHHLDTVVAVLNDTRQHIVLELGIGAHLLGILSHTHMALVDQQWILLRLKGLLREHIGLLGIPYLSREYLGIVILHHPTTPGRDTFTFTTIPLYLHLVKVTVLQGFL